MRSLGQQQRQDEQEQARAVEVTDEELKGQAREGVEVLDLNDQRNRVKRSTWYRS